MKVIEQFAGFIKENRLGEVVNRQLDLYRINNVLLPSLKASPEQATTYFKERLYLFLTALENGSEQKYIKNRLAAFQNNEIPILSVSEASLFHLMQAASLQKVALVESIPYFTRNANEVIEISLALEHLTTQTQAFILHSFESIQQKLNSRFLASEEKYKNLFDSAHDMIHIVEPDGKIIYVNAAWMKSLEYTIDEIQGKSIYAFVTPEDRERFKQYRENVLNSTSKDDEITASLQTKSGKKIVVEGFVSPKFENGIPVYTQGIFRNITQRLVNEQQLQYYNEQLIEREENLQQLIRHAPDAIIVIDVSGKIILWNPKAEEIFGWKEHEVLKRKLEETIIPEQYQQAHIQGMNRYLTTGEARILNRTIEITALNRHKEEFFISLTISQSQNSEGIIFIAFIRDITPQKRNEAELERKRRELENSNQELEQYGWLTSHDLREPLRKILTYSDIILTAHNGHLPDDIKKPVLKIYDAATRMRSLIEAILHYSSITNEHSLFSKVNLNQLVHEVLNDLELEIKEKQAIVDVHPLPTIEAVSFQMRQLFQNLIGNALKYHKPSEKPFIEIQSKNIDVNAVELTVKDQGIGFEMKDEKKVFQLFQRLHTQQSIAGTGVGLALCKKIVQNHGGTISVASEVNKGTTFCITLPVMHTSMIK